MNKFNEMLDQIIKKNLSRSIKTCEYDPNFFDVKKIIIGDIICESILPSPYMLINDIINKLKNNENEFTYNKNDLKRLSDKDWKFYNQINKLPDDFSLTIIRCNYQKYFKKYNIMPTKKASMEEIVDPKNEYNEHIWINEDDDDNFVYDSQFKNLLKHELGHVWTFIFGTLDDEFKDGQSPSNENKSLNPLKFNNYQKDVYLHLYERNLNLLNFDYKYVLCKTNENDTANYELSVHIDNIIEILIEDYFESMFNDTKTYLKYLWECLNLNYNYSLKHLNLLKYFYENKKLYNGYSTIKSIKNPIRRLFLIFAFGTKEQIEYFKKACEDEFGNLS
jgi:hypothetical protein